MFSILAFNLESGREHLPMLSVIPDPKRSAEKTSLLVKIW